MVSFYCDSKKSNSVECQYIGVGNMIAHLSVHYFYFEMVVSNVIHLYLDSLYNFF